MMSVHALFLEQVMVYRPDRACTCCCGSCLLGVTAVHMFRSYLSGGLFIGGDMGIHWWGHGDAA